MPELSDILLRVGGGTPCKQLAAAIFATMEKTQKDILVEYIGAGAGNQAVKAIAIASARFALNGKIIAAYPRFQERALKDNPDAVAMQFRLTLQNA